MNNDDATANQQELPIEKQNHVALKEQIAFYASALLRDMSYALIGWLSYFYIDVLGFKSYNAIPYILIMIVVRLWDGVNDPLMGMYFDKSGTKDGKARPFFKKTGLITAVLIVLMFVAPTFSKNDAVNIWLRFAFAFIIFVAFSALHSLNGTAFMTYYNSISPNPDERARIISYSRIFSNIGSAIVGGLIPILISLFENDNVVAKTYIYLGTACFVALCFYLYNRIMYRSVKERVYATGGNYQKVKDMLGVFFKNKLLLLLMISNSIAGIITTGATSLYFYTYNMNNAALATYIGFASIPTFFIGAFLTPFLIKKTDKRNIMIYCSIAQIAINLLYIIVGYNSIAFVCVITMLQALPSTVRGVVYWNMIADTVDYIEWKTGERNDGMVYAAEGFFGKCVGSLSGIMAGLFLVAIKFEENALTQKAETIKGLFYIPLIVAIISTILSTIPFFFYKFGRKEHEKVVMDLKERRESANSTNEPQQDVVNN